MGTSSERASVGSGEQNRLYGVPQKCYCGVDPVLLTCTSNENLGRLYYACNNKEGEGCNIRKWWDDAVKEEFLEIKMKQEKLEEHMLWYINKDSCDCHDEVHHLNVLSKAAEDKYEELKAMVEEIQSRDWSLEFERNVVAVTDIFDCHCCYCGGCSLLDSSF